MFSTFKNIGVAVGIFAAAVITLAYPAPVMAGVLVAGLGLATAWAAVRVTGD